MRQATVVLELGELDRRNMSRPVRRARLARRHTATDLAVVAIVVEHVSELRPGHVRPSGVRLLWTSATVYEVGSRRTSREHFLREASRRLEDA